MRISDWSSDVCSSDLRLAGLNPSGVICEIMNDDGTMARLPDLIGFAQLHGLKIGTIADLIAYRRRNDNLIDKVVEGEIDSAWGGKFRMLVYRNRVEYRSEEHTSELQSLMRSSYAVFCLIKKSSA